MKSTNSTSQPKSAPQAGPDGTPETPKQKVERLRAQARAARMAQSSSGVDRWIEFGRRFANKAHKGMVYSLILASGMFNVPLQCRASMAIPVPLRVPGPGPTCLRLRPARRDILHADQEYRFTNFSLFN